MSAHAYTEDQLVEPPAIGLFAELGCTPTSALEEVFVPIPFEAGRSRGHETHSFLAKSQSLFTSSPTICLGRETKGEVVLVSRLHAALGRLNPALPPEGITAASISPKILVLPRGGITVLSETPAVKDGLGLIERLTADFCKSLMYSMFLFEWKTSL